MICVYFLSKSIFWKRRTVFHLQFQELTKAFLIGIWTNTATGNCYCLIVCIICSIPFYSNILISFFCEFRSLLRGHYSIDSPYLWRRYFHQQIFPSPITVLDVSHLYWLNTGVLNNCICDLPNLEELCVQDTKISLANFPRVFEACQKIVKLSLTFVESDLESCEEQVLGKKALEGIKKGFRRLTHLKMFVFFLDDQGCAESWLNILGVLK